MTDIVVYYQALIRELINGSAMVLFLTLTIMVGVFMWDTMLEYAGRKPPSNWTDAPGIGTACALWWIFAAETYRTGAVWILYQLGKRANDTGTFFSADGYATSYGYLLAGLALNGGLLRAIYIFTPPEWKNKVWIHASIGSMLFVASPTVIITLRNFINGI